MKIRNGFVSNSSSSSFIVGYGLIRQNGDAKKRLIKYLEDNKIEHIVVEDAGNKYRYADIAIFDRFNMGPADRIITAGNDTELIIPRKICEDFNNDGIMRVEIQNNEGDGGVFYHWDGTDEPCDSGYEKAEHIEFYNEKQQKIIRLFEDKTIFKNSKVKIGAERNG